MTRHPSRASLDVRLTTALRPLAESAPMPDGLLDVPRASLSAPSPGRPWLVLPVVGAAVVITLLVVGALSGVLPTPRVGDDGPSPVPIDGLNLEPRVLALPAIVGIRAEAATGPVVQVARGNVEGSAFLGAAYRSAQGPCLSYRWLNGGGDGCGSLPQDDLGGGVGLGQAIVHPASDLPGMVFGLASPDTARVTLGTLEGELLDLGMADIEAQAFVLFFPTGFSETGLAAFDADGVLIGRIGIADSIGGHEPPAGVPVPAGGVDRHPQMRVVLRNHTDRDVDSTVHESSTEAAGSVGGPTPPCDLGDSGIAAYEGTTWRVEVDGRELVRSDASTPAVRSGEVLEVLIDVRQGQEPTVTSIMVLPIEESTAWTPLEREPNPWWNQRMWDLARGLECEPN